MDEGIVQIVPEGSVILDPFAGSGTTCVAAKKHNRQYIGFEKTEVYYDIAEKRMNEVR
ncbi:DNA methyltransferase [Megasphaera cerevisiae]|uniref:DNA methyltransferase n=1 Tax=Megasphaera cerevisiae TaxID=39029 RepID=UPI00099AC506|nr:DNA methyltransferase [Megasphaera cerevisiae]